MADIFLFAQAQLDEYIRRLEEAERNIKIAEAKIAERDQRIMEVERLLECMGKVSQKCNVCICLPVPLTLEQNCVKQKLHNTLRDLSYISQMFRKR